MRYKYKIKGRVVNGRKLLRCSRVMLTALHYGQRLTKNAYTDATAYSVRKEYGINCSKLKEEDKNNFRDLVTYVKANAYVELEKFIKSYEHRMIHW